MNVAGESRRYSGQCGELRDDCEVEKKMICLRLSVLTIFESKTKIHVLKSLKKPRWMDLDRLQLVDNVGCLLPVPSPEVAEFSPSPLNTP